MSVITAVATVPKYLKLETKYIKHGKYLILNSNNIEEKFILLAVKFQTKNSGNITLQQVQHSNRKVNDNIKTGTHNRHSHQFNRT